MGLFPVPFFNVRLEVGLCFVKITLKSIQSNQTFRI